MTLCQKATGKCAPPKREIKPKKKTTWNPEYREEQLYRSREPSVHITAEV